MSRIAALIAGLAILTGAAIVTIGVALCAPLGVWIVARFLRARRRPLDTWGSWMSAVGSVAITLILIAGVAAIESDSA